jgi:hypothetical protein
MDAHSTYATVTYRGLHMRLCDDGDDSCGGPFTHKRSLDDMVKEVLQKIDAITKPNEDTDEPVIGQGSDQHSEKRTTQRPVIKATANPTGTFQTSSDVTHPHLRVDGRHTSAKQPGIKSKLFTVDGRRKSTAQVAGTGQLKEDVESEDEVSEPSTLQRF